MAGTDLTLASTLKPSSGYRKYDGLSNEAIIAGQVVYRDPATSKFIKAIATSLNASNVAGIALVSTPGADQPLQVMYDGIITNLSGLTAGALYVLSETTAGALMRTADLAATDWGCVVLWALSATTAKVIISPSGVVHV